jgi:thiosulfate/3-mercaptopyruvate sulfurtransferase
MPASPSRWLVETEWLAERLDSPDLIVLDGSMHLPTSGRNARAEYTAAHIPNALYFDIDEIADKSNPLPHMMPSTVQFASQVKKMGIGDGSQIVVYDSEGLYSAARVWWMFRTMGHDDVAILNGGLKKWKAEGRPLEDGQPVARTARHFTPLLNNSLVRDLDDMKGYAASGKMQIVDARPKGRFEGTEPEPRPGLRGGHIPGAKNVPSATILNGDGALKSKPELEKIFRDAGIDPAKPVVTTCGSGVTASMLSLALAVIGQTNAAVYDGSWAEWGQEKLDTPVQTGPAKTG